MTEPAIGELIALAHRVPAPYDQVFAGASETDLVAFESRVGHIVPPGFRAWLRTVNGAMIGPGGVFGIRDPSDILSIERHLRIYPQWRQTEWLPVASDGLGNYWVTLPLGPDGSSDWVAFVDTHQDPGVVDRYVASSFPRFMGFLLQSELGETRWPGDKEYDLRLDPALASAPAEKSAWTRR